MVPKAHIILTLTKIEGNNNCSKFEISLFAGATIKLMINWENS